MLLELILKLKGFPLSEAKQHLSQLQRMPSAEFQAWQEKKRWEIAQYHFEHNKAYRALCIPGFPEKWESLPVVQKQNLQGNLDEMLSLPFKRRCVHIGSTSGSSGHPFYYAKNKFAHAMTYALIGDRYAWHGLSLRQKQARFYGIPMSGNSRWLELAKDLAFNRVRFPVFDLSDGRLKQYLKQFAATKFEYLYGYTSALAIFARFLKAEGKILNEVCPTITACIVTSEVCSEEDKLLMEQAFGVPVLNEYGASELDIIAFTDKQGIWALSAENLFVEVLDDKGQQVPDGTVGRIVVTALHNRAFPMVRYDIGDQGSIGKNGANQLHSLAGRTNDVILLPSGKKAAGLTFYYISRKLLESGGNVQEFVIKQTAIDTFLIEIVANQPLGEGHIESIKQSMEEYLEPGLQFRIQYVDRIHRPPNGKTKHFFSLIQ